MNSLISMKEASQRLNIGVNLTRKLVNAGYLDFLQITREKSVISSSVDEFIEKYKNKDIRNLIKEQEEQ